MRKLRSYYWIFQSFFNKYKKIILPAAILGAVTFTQLELIIKYVPRPKPTIHVGRVGTYTLSNLPKDIQSQVSTGLTQIDESGTPLPALAHSWKITDEGKTYIFSLNSDLKWQDGTSLTSSDISYNITDAQLETPDDNTVVFKLKEPFAPFPTIVSQPLFKRVQINQWQIKKKSLILGTGEYRIRDIGYDGSYLDYVVLDSSKDKKVYHFYETEKNAITAFKLAEIDVIEDITDPAELADWPHIGMVPKTNMQRYLAVFFNTEDRNLTNKTVRQALTYAIPGKPNNASRAISPISPDSWAYNPNVKPYLFSLDKAKELATGTNMSFELELSTTPTYAKLAEEIRNSWGQLGVNVKVKVTNVPDTQNFQALLIGQQIPLDPDQYLLWHSTQNSNITNYQSPKVDKLLEDGRTQLDTQKRKEIYLDFQRFLVEDSPAAFLYYLDTFTIKRSE